MSKRGAGTELNKDNYEREIEREGSEEAGTWQKADEATMAQRKIRKAKRPSQRPESAAEPASAAPKANPFANVQLVAPPSSAPAAGGFSFGTAAPSAAPATAPFSFGAPASAAPAAPTFSFGGAPSTAKPAETKPAAAGFSFGGGEAAPAAAPVFGAAPAASPSLAPAPAAGFSFGGGASSTAAPAAPLFGGGPPPAAVPLFGKPTPSAAANGGGAAAGEAKDEAKALNQEFKGWLEAEWEKASTADWAAGVRDYIRQRVAMGSGGGVEGAAPAAPAAAAAAPAFGLFSAAPAAGGGSGLAFGGTPAPSSGAPAAFGGLFGGGAPLAAAPLFGTPAAGGAPAPASSLFGAPASAPAPAPAPVPAPAPAPAEASEGGDAGGAEEKVKRLAKLSVYRQEKKSADGELIQDKGWKAIGKGQLRLLCSDGVHFLDFRPEVSESSAAGDADPGETMSGKARFGRSVLSARLTKGTKFDVTKRSMQTNLASRDAAGTTVYARYNVLLESDAVAAEVAAQMRACLPSE